MAKASELLAGGDPDRIAELSIQVLVEATQIGIGRSARGAAPEASSLSRVTRVIRMIDADPEAPQDLASLAEIARLSPYHFLRTFEAVTGATPHQYILRMRLRRAAIRLRTETGRILDIALGCGFEDVSNFNRAFRAEFGMSPRSYRLTA